jgi:hypothetical protein
MDIFFGYFIWGLIIAAPLWWLAWRLRLGRYLPDWAKPASQRPLELPQQLDALVIRGKRRKDLVIRRPSAARAAVSAPTQTQADTQATLAEPRS